jgi:hypothetical protein
MIHPKVSTLTLLLHGGVQASRSMTETFTYRVRSVAGKNRILQDPFLTFSDDGATREDEFFLDLFETPTQLSDPESPGAIRTAMNSFLFDELRQIYTGTKALESVSSEIVALAPLEDQVSSSTGEEITRTGTEVRMRVALIFVQQPSPSGIDVVSKMRSVMSNLTYFVSNLTSTAESINDAELSDVYEATRREIPLPPETTPNSTDAVVDEDPSDGEEDPLTPSSKSSVASAAVPIVLVVAVLVALIVFLVFRRKRGRAESESPKNSAIMYMDVENEIYSLDRSVESSKSPIHGMMSPPEDEESSIQYSVSGDSQPMSPAAGDSIFSGIETEYNNARSSKSIMTGLTIASASTIHVSNLDRRKKVATPKSFAASNSLFAFSEEVDGMYDSDQEDHNDGLLGRVPSLSQSEVSEDSQAGIHFSGDRQQSDSQPNQTPNESKPSVSGVEATIDNQEQQEKEIHQAQSIPSDQASRAIQQNPWCGIAPGSVSYVLADLENMQTARDGSTPRDPTPTVARVLAQGGELTREPTPCSGEAGTYRPFSCAPAAYDAVLDKQNPNEMIDSDVTIMVRKTNTKIVSHAKGMNEVFSPDENNQKSVAGAPHSAGSISSTMPTPLMRNNNEDYQNGHEREKNVAGMSARATNLMSGIFGRSKRKSLSTPSSPTRESQALSPKSSGGSISEPNTPTERKVGGHWLASSNKGKEWRPPTSPRMDSDGDYDMNLSRPSTPGDELNDSLQVPDYAKEDSYSCLPYAKIVDRPPKDPPAIDQHGGRRHAGDRIGGDGSAMYQTNAMHPLDWSYKSGDAGSVGESTISESDQPVSNQYIFKNKGGGQVLTDANLSPDGGLGNSRTPKSEATRESVASSRASASRQLINDLVWLENKIAGVRQSSNLGPPDIENSDSMSYVSNDNDGFASAKSQDDSHDQEEDPTVSTGQNNSVMSSIVCRDCYAPPGKLHIVIHSTKDGPAVHTVKEGSSLEGHIFPGDLIISVDNVDTRSFTAEQVMKMMASKGDKERKITVLHFEEEE